MIHQRRWRRGNVHVQLSFLEEKVDDEIVAVWSTLSNDQRAEVLATLARVIAQLVLAPHAATAPEKDHE
jgi:predicted Fe-S protein YdhL (DUF1289 family)